jgi:hypothetical protein
MIGDFVSQRQRGNIPQDEAHRVAAGRDAYERKECGRRGAPGSGNFAAVGWCRAFDK